MVPEQKQDACIHVDLDGASAIYAAHNWGRHGCEDRLFETGFLNLLRFFQTAGIHATFFAIAEDLEDGMKRELIREAILRGHEIASHSLTHRLLSTLSRDEKRKEVFESRARLESVLGVAIQGFRAPGFDIDRETLEMIDEAGYRYDSSLFPTKKFARKVEVTDVSISPQVVIPNRRLIELPLPKHNPLPVPFHICYSLVLGAGYFRFGLRRFRQTGAPMVLLFHLTDMADPLGGLHNRSWKEKFFTLSFLRVQEKIFRCKEMVDAVQESYRFVKTEQLLQAVHVE